MPSFDGYIRVSRRMGRSGPGYISPSVQKEAIARWAEYRGVEIAKWHEDEDESGGTQNRPGLKLAIQRIERKETDGIACWRLNRFARNVAEAIEEVKRIQALGGQLAFVEEDIDPTGPFGSFLLTVLLAVATLERDNMVAGWETAKDRAIERGAHIGPTPYGYERAEDGRLVRADDQTEHLQEAYRLAATRGLHAAYEYLLSNAPGRTWRLWTVRRTLANRTYRGELTNGDNRVNTEAHEPLVTEAVWKLAQSEPSERRAPSADFPLSGVARCGTCLEPMIGSRAGANLRTYRCSATLSWYKGDRCPRGANVVAKNLEEFVLAGVQPLLAGLVAEGVDHPDDLVIAERKMLDADAELEAFAADHTLRRALGPSYAKHRQARIEAQEQAREAYRAAQRAAEGRERITAKELIDIPKLGDLLRDLGHSVVVQQGRGRLSERVGFVPDDELRAD